jgi:geranylgeranylglycerol-phosphate geranylgeranyltransferase
MHLRDWYDLTRLDHGILWGVAVVIGESLAYRGFPPLKFAVLGFVIPVLIEVGIFALNDYIDIDSDILNKRNDRPLTRHAIPTQYPLYFSLAVLPVSIVLGVLTGLTSPLLIVVIFIVLGILYNVKLKELPLVKNFIMGLCIAAPLIGGNLLITNEILPVIMVLGICAFTAGFGREVLKDMMDTLGDKSVGCTTFPILFGLRRSAVLVSSLIVTAGIFILLPYLYPFDRFYYHDPFYLIPACATNVLIITCVYSLIKDTSHKNIQVLRKRTLHIIELGMVTFIVGALL